MGSDLGGRCVAVTLAAVSLFVLAGCAFGNRNVQLVTTPTAGYARVKGDFVVGVQKFSDSRPERALGEVRNGWGMRTASAVAEGQDVGAWVSDAIAEELAGAGLQIRKFEGNAVPPDAQVLVSGDVLEAFVRMYMSYNTNMRAKVTVSAQGTNVLQREFSGQATGIAMFAVTSEYEEQLRIAHRALLDQIVPAILELFK